MITFTYIIIKMHQNTQIQDLQGVCTACAQRAHGALEDTTALPQRSHCGLCNNIDTCSWIMLEYREIIYPNFLWIVICTLTRYLYNHILVQVSLFQITGY